MMAQLLSPVCTNTLKFQYPVQSFCSRNRCSMFGVNWSSHRRRRKTFGRVRVASQYSKSHEDIADDYYSVLGLLSDATPEQIKKAYYNCMKACHPDLSGNDPETTNFCMFINEVYAVLSDPVQRMIYDEIHGYSLTAINPFLDDSSPKDYVFVDEFSCIGCKNCKNVCPSVFTIEEDFGRARAYSQSGNPESVQDAVNSCLFKWNHVDSTNQCVTTSAITLMVYDPMCTQGPIETCSRWIKVIGCRSKDRKSVSRTRERNKQSQQVEAAEPVEPTIEQWNVIGMLLVLFSNCFSRVICCNCNKGELVRGLFVIVIRES